MARPKNAVKTVADIDAEILRLQKERETLRSAEAKEFVLQVKEGIRRYGLTAEDLGLAPKRRGKRLAVGAVGTVGAKKRAARTGVKTAKKPASPPKYTNGVDKTWSGHGQRPGWFVEALAAGKTAEDMLIKPAT